jgi:hypothetical protein
MINILTLIVICRVDSIHAYAIGPIHGLVGHGCNVERAELRVHMGRACSPTINYNEPQIGLDQILMMASDY